TASQAQTTFTDDPQTNTTVISNNNPSNVGDSVTFTATVAKQGGGGGDPTCGTVTFCDGGSCSATGTCSGGGTALGSRPVNTSHRATPTSGATSPPPFSLGPNTILACYHATSGCAFQDSNSSLTETVGGTNTALASSLNPSTFGQSVTFTATVTAQK